MAEYYTGDSIPLGVTVIENNVALAVVSAKASVYRVDGGVKVVDGAVAAPGGASGNEVTYIIGKGVITVAGEYRAYLVCAFSGSRERTYEFEFEVLPNPRV